MTDTPTGLDAVIPVLAATLDGLAQVALLVIVAAGIAVGLIVGGVARRWLG